MIDPTTRWKSLNAQLDSADKIIDYPSPQHFTNCILTTIDQVLYRKQQVRKTHRTQTLSAIGGCVQHLPTANLAS